MPKVSPSVLIIRLDGIGDALALTPLLAAMRKRAVPVDLVLRPANAEIFSTAAVRSVTVTEFELRSSERANLAAIEQLAEQLRVHGYSHVLVATEDPGGYRLAAGIGAPERIGFADAWGKPFKALWLRRLLTRTIYRSAGLDRRGPHECEVLFELGRSLLDANAQPTRDLAELRPLVLDEEPLSDERIAVQITDKYERMGVTLDEVVELVRRLEASGPLHLVAARHEAAYAQRVADATAQTVEYFGAIDAWKAAIAAAPAIVTPDSGSLHVAGMIGTPVVAIFPPANYALQVARWAPWAARHRIVRSGRGWPGRGSEALAHLLSS